MYFFGKIIGVFLGFKWGGFFGAIAGLILGSIADKKLYELGSVNSSFFKKKNDPTSALYANYFCGTWTFK